VANAQAMELKLSQALTGDPARDSKNIETLSAAFAGGIKQNQKNKADVSNYDVVYW
jgi:hypothetical protein